MDVSVTDLRGRLSDWLGRVQDGEDVVITERGTPVARIIAISASELIQDLESSGQLGRPTSRTRPRAGDRRLAKATTSVSDMVSAQRD